MRHDHSTQSGIAHLGIVVVLLVLAAAGFAGWRVVQSRNAPSVAGDDQRPVAETTAATETTTASVVFTHNIVDPARISHIIPLGELNGGYEETQTINGVTITIRTDASGTVGPVDVYAPADMTLTDYSRFSEDGSPNWHLGFTVSNDIKLSFDHITSVVPDIESATPATSNSAYVPPVKTVRVKAGQLIARTTGTPKAHNWNIYLRDNRHTNTFVNQARYDKLKDTYNYVHAACPFDYYQGATKQQFIDLMGFSAAGQAKSCGTNSRDAKGSISGLWFLTKDGMGADYQEGYATPFSIYRVSDGSIVLYEINRQRYILDAKNATYKDPATVTDAHCYALTRYGGERPDGYAYFKVVSDMEMQLAYGVHGSCPSVFPQSSAKSYYR